MIWVDGFLAEIDKFGVSSDRLRIDPQAMIIDRVDRAAEEMTLRGQIGSTAQGVGWATSRKVLRGGAPHPVKLARDEPQLRPYLGDAVEAYSNCMSRGGRILLEGTQGTALSLHHGSYPHVTSRDTTAAACLSEAGLPVRATRKVIMVCRTYPIRVASPPGGTSGPMEGEIDLATVAQRSGIPLDEIERTERTTTTNRPRRIAEFDWDLLNRSVLLNRPTDIALTFVDYISVTNRDAVRFEDLTEETREFVARIERESDAPVTLLSTKFHHQGVIDRRDWES